MQRILYMMIKEFRQIFRTREMLAVIFGVPLVQMVVLGFTITNEVKNVSLLIADQDDSNLSRELIRAFEQTDRFKMSGYTLSQRNINEAMQNWKTQMVLIIPPNFARNLQRNLQPDIQILVDGLDGNTAGIASGYAQGILSSFSEQWLKRQFHQIPKHKSHSVFMQERVWYNPNLDNAQYMIPGIVVLLITIISMMLSGISLVKEKEIGTLEQLMVTPLQKHQLLLGKVLPFLCLTFIELTIVMVAAQFIFSLEVQGSYILFGLLSFIFLFTTIGLGIFVSTITSTQQQAMFVAWFMMVFMLMMSGFFIPIENMPETLQKITYLNPMRYFLYITRDIFQKGSTLKYLLNDVIPMTIYGILIFGFSVLKFRKRIA